MREPMTVEELRGLIASKQKAAAACAELEELRRKAHLSQAECAAFIGCTGPAISRWATGERFPRSKQWERLELLVETLRNGSV